MDVTTCPGCGWNVKEPPKVFCPGCGGVWPKRGGGLYISKVEVEKREEEPAPKKKAARKTTKKAAKK